MFDGAENALAYCWQEQFYRRAVATQRDIALTARHAAAEFVPLIRHKDPFDEKLLVHAEQARMRLLTRDGKRTAHSPAVAGA